MLIYQDDIGGDNTDKTPKGGIVFQISQASSMMTTTANPITFYGSWGAVINQSGHSGDLYNYYWTSYSRGTDGRLNGSTNEPNWHNDYLDGYIPLRVKSIYDPCPYLYRISSNGTYNQFTIASGWIEWSYLGGRNWSVNNDASWLPGLGRRSAGSGAFAYTGSWGESQSSTTVNQTHVYTFEFSSGQVIYYNYAYVQSTGLSVRCIESVRI